MNYSVKMFVCVSYFKIIKILKGITKNYSERNVKGYHVEQYYVSQKTHYCKFVNCMH